MAIITFPATARIASADWRLDRPAQVNRSLYTGRDQVMANPWHGRWSASIALAPIIGEANILAWRSFLAQLDGQVNTFRLPATEAAQTAQANVTVSGSVAAGASSIAFAGGPISTTLLTAGRLITLNDQLMVLTADAVTNGTGAGTFTVKPLVRNAATNGTTIQIQRPTALVALAQTDIGWAVDRGQVYGVEFSVEERF